MVLWVGGAQLDASVSPVWRLDQADSLHSWHDSGCWLGIQLGLWTEASAHVLRALPCGLSISWHGNWAPQRRIPWASIPVAASLLVISFPKSQGVTLAAWHWPKAKQAGRRKFKGRDIRFHSAVGECHDHTAEEHVEWVILLWSLVKNVIRHYTYNLIFILFHMYSHTVIVKTFLGMDDGKNI